MGRNALAATSLVAALPAGFLAYLSIMAFVRYTEHMGAIPLAINAAITGISVLMAISPIVILVGKRRDTDAGEADAEAAADDEPLEGEEGEAVATATEEAPSSFDDDIDAAETDAYNFDADDFDDAEAADDGDHFEFDDEDDEFN